MINESRSAIGELLSRRTMQIRVIEQANSIAPIIGGAYHPYTDKYYCSLTFGEIVMTNARAGDFVAGKGVYAGTYEVNGVVKEVYVASYLMDVGSYVLKDRSGRSQHITFNELAAETAKRNGGRRYGNGSELAVRKAIASGKPKGVVPLRFFSPAP